MKAALIGRINTVTFANVGSVRLPSLKFVDFVYSADSVQTCDDWYTNGHFCCFDCLLTVFDEWYSVPIVKNTQNHWCINRHRSTKTVLTVYQSSKTVKNSQKTVKTAQKWPLVYQSSRVYQDCTNSVTVVYQLSKTAKNSQTAKNDHWCTNRHMSAQSPPNTQSPRPRRRPRPPNTQSRLRVVMLPSSEWK